MLAARHELVVVKLAMATEQRKHRKARLQIILLKDALRRCAEKFRFYEQQHLAKTPPDTAKAETNKAMAVMCEFFK